MPRDLKTALITPMADILRHTMPWNLLTLTMVAKQDGLDVRLIDIKTTRGIEDAYRMIFEKLAEDVPDIIGLPCSTADVLDVRRIVKDVKKRYPDMIFIVGGIHVTTHPEDFFEEDHQVDYGITGYGELPFNSLLNALNEGDIEKARALPNVIYRGPEGMVKNIATNEMFDLQELPVMDFELLDMEHYAHPNEDVLRGIPISCATIYTTIGCPYKCSFCVSGGLWDLVKRVRYKKVNYVVDEIETLVKRYKFDAFYIYDDVFILNKKYVKDVCAEILRRKIKVVWGCQSTVHVVDDDIARTIRKAGCVQLDYGVESGSTEALERMNKHWAKVEKTRQTFAICKKHGIRTLANWMFNTPGEKMEDVEATLAQAKEIKPNTNVFNFFIPWPGGADGDNYWNKTTNGRVDFALFEAFVRGMSWHEHLETIDTRFRQTEHNVSFVDIYKRIVRDFPVRSNFHLKFSLQWLGQFMRLISWVYSPWYYGVLFRSKRKMGYLRWFFKIVKGLIPKKILSFDKRTELHLSMKRKRPEGPGQTVRID